MKALLLAVAKKYKFPLSEADLADLPEPRTLGGNEIEGILVRALRVFELQGEPKRPLKEILADVFKDVRPSAHAQKMEYMDWIAVKECTDARFLPPRFRDVPPAEVERNIQERRRFV